MEQGTTIRPCARKDFRAVRVLFHTHFPVELTYKRLDRELWDAYRDIAVATIDGEVVGATWVRHGLQPGLCWLDFIAVDRTHRRRGIAKQLLKASERMALAAGERRIGLAVRTENSVALTMYAQIGFREMSSNEFEYRLEREIDATAAGPLAPPRRAPSVVGRCLDFAAYRILTFGA